MKQMRLLKSIHFENGEFKVSHEFWDPSLLVPKEGLFSEISK